MYTTIRWMIRRDMPEVLAIENSTTEHPNNEQQLLKMLRRKNCIGMVAEHGEKIVGFMIYELHKDRITVADFAVHPDYQKMRVGWKMIAKLVGKLSSGKYRLVRFYVRETNLAAQLFLRRLNFAALRTERAFFADTKEDAYVMEYEFDEELALVEKGELITS